MTQIMNKAILNKIFFLSSEENGLENLYCNNKKLKKNR